MYVNIETERIRNELSKKDMADRLGVTYKTYQFYVKGVTPIPSTALITLSEVFNCSVDYLLGLSERNAN